MDINKATFTFDRMPELRVGGETKKFGEIEVDGKKFQGVQLKDGTIARLNRRDDGKFDVTLIAGKGKDLSNRSVRVQGGNLSRLRSKEGDKYDVPVENWKTLRSGMTLRLDAKFAEKMTKGVEPRAPKIELRVPEEEIVITDQRSEGDSNPSISLGRPRSNAISGRKEDDSDPSIQGRPRSNAISGRKEDDSDPSIRGRPRSNAISGRQKDDPDPSV